MQRTGKFCIGNTGKGAGKVLPEIRQLQVFLCSKRVCLYSKRKHTTNAYKSLDNKLNFIKILLRARVAASTSCDSDIMMDINRPVFDQTPRTRCPGPGATSETVLTAHFWPGSRSLSQLTALGVRNHLDTKLSIHSDSLLPHRTSTRTSYQWFESEFP